MALSKAKGKKSTQRKLTAILCADVVGYSRLMGADEESTIETLTAYRKVFTSEIKNHSGRVVDAKGDAILAEFASVVDAVNSAVEIQRELAEKNAALPGERRMDFRIGINLGDVVVKDDVIYGDGVNVAARLETLAEPGGVCISGSAYAQVRNKLKLEYEFLGNKEVKNIAEPVPVFRVLSVPGAAAHRVVGTKATGEGHWRRTALVLAAGLVLVVGLVAAGYFLQPEDAPDQADKASITHKPVIAVLAFDDLSPNKSQDLFAEAISENIIAQLARIRGLNVISRNSAFSFKGKSVQVQEIGRKLGARYVLEGSVQRSGDRTRIIAQLIDAPNGNHVWTERYESAEQDLFALQDEIIRKIVAALEVQLTMDQTTRVRYLSTENLEAWNYYIRGLKLLRGATLAEKTFAIDEFETALELDPEFSAAMLGVGWSFYEVKLFGRSTLFLRGVRALDKASEMSNRALAIDPTLAEPHALLGSVELLRGNYDSAIARMRRAATLEPGVAEWKMRLASALSWAGNSDEAHSEMKQALRLEPFPADIFLESWCRILYQTGEYKEAIRLAKDLLNRTPERTQAHVILIASYGALGRIAEARKEHQRYLDSNIIIAKSGIEGMAQVGQPKVYAEYRMPFQNPDDSKRIMNDVSKAIPPE